MDSKNLFVDIGNSSISFKINQTYATFSIQDFHKDLIPKHQKAFISCVANQNLLALFNEIKLIKPYKYKNINFNYDLNQLGVDRFLNIVAGINLFPNIDLMIIDIGTCLTVEYIIDNNHHNGGIAPGKNLMKNSFNFDGKDSINAWESGINDMLSSYLLDKIDKFNGKILLTGGDQNIIKLQNKNISYHQNLVLDGLEFLANQKCK